MPRQLMLIPCDICTSTPALFVARCGLLVCQKCWQEETLLCKEVPGENAGD